MRFQIFYNTKSKICYRYSYSAIFILTRQVNYIADHKLPVKYIKVWWL